ncbi:MAG: hypothetical protein JSR58_06000 [Verrucomicrobia bacterium]|nr:hypothetical protein [Verrucomicrobiota bacterium]
MTPLRHAYSMSIEPVRDEYVASLLVLTKAKLLAKIGLLSERAASRPVLRAGCALFC